MEFIYPTGRSNWKVMIQKRTPHYRSLNDPHELIVKDTHTLEVLFRCDYQSEEKCLDVWEHLKRAYETGRCKWDSELHRFVWSNKRTSIHTESRV
jgi:hypothetical protein